MLFLTEGNAELSPRSVRHEHRVLVSRLTVHPIFTSGPDHQAGTIFDPQMQSVQAGLSRSRAETEHIVVRQIVGYRDKTCLQILFPEKLNELASGELRDRFGGVGPERIP